MAIVKGTSFSKIYENFLSKITDDMYMQLTPEETYQILRELLLSAIHKFEFPRQSLDYQLKKIKKENDNTIFLKWYFTNRLTNEEINILSNYMIVEWLGQQLASVENTRMKFSGSDFKFTSQANHMQKLLQLKKDYERQGFHLQRLYKRRVLDKNGIYRSTFSQIMQKPNYINTNSILDENLINTNQDTLIQNFLLVRGISFTLDLIIPESQNDINLINLYFTVKNKNQSDDKYVFQKNLLNGITLIGKSQYRITIDAEDTINLLFDKYNYDLKIEFDNNIFTVIKGNLIIKDSIN